MDVMDLEMHVSFHRHLKWCLGNYPMWMRVSLKRLRHKIKFKNKNILSKKTLLLCFQFSFTFLSRKCRIPLSTQRANSHTLREVLRSYFYVLLFRFLQFLPSILILFFRSTWFGVLPQRRDTFTSAINEEITELTRRRGRDENVAMMELPIN